MKINPGSNDKCSGDQWYPSGNNNSSLGTGLRMVTPAEDILKVD